MVLWPAGCQQKGQQEVKSETLEINLAVHGTPYSGLIAVADEKGFFKEAGLKVKINLYPSGLESLKAMQRGDAQVATVADIAFALEMFEDQSIRTIASIGTSMGAQIVARKDRNIHAPADLKGKRIGYSPLTSSEYFLYAFLLSQRVSRNDITPVAIPPARQAEAIVSGEIDGLSAFDVYAFVAQKQLGENCIVWSSQSDVDFLWLLAIKESTAQSPEAIKRLLRALIRSEEYVADHVEDAKAIIARKWNVDPEYVRYSWDQTRLFVSFNQSVITALQNYARWKMNTEEIGGDPPDVLHFIHTAALEEVNPKLVAVFR